MKERLQKFITEHGLKHWSFAARKDQEFVLWVFEKTPEMVDGSFAERVWCAVNDESIFCKNGNRKQFNTIIKGLKFCGKTGVCACAKKSVSQSVSNTRAENDYSQSHEKARQTLLVKYGVNNAGRLPQAIENHNAVYNNPDKVKEINAKVSSTMYERYGVDNALKMPSIDRKHITRNIIHNISDYTQEILDDPEKLKEFISDKSIPYVSELLGINESTINNYIRKYNIPRELGSSFENEIAAFLNYHNLKYISRDRTLIAPYELDFYLPELNVAIEFNGLYFHSSFVISDDKHELKLLLAEKNKIRLLMINEDEWIERKEAIKRKILNLCGKSERGVGARHLEVRKISIGTAINFIEQNHIQGKTLSCVDAFGAFHNENLVSVITLSRQRGTSNLELSRFCTDGKIYAGVFSKMIKEIRKYYQEPILTFADLRYSDGNLYRKTGFVEVCRLKPDYRYVRRNKTYHKSSFSKNKIKAKFGIDVGTRTERQIMEELGYSRIYDCGKIKFILE